MEVWIPLICRVVYLYQSRGLHEESMTTTARVYQTICRRQLLMVDMTSNSPLATLLFLSSVLVHVMAVGRCGRFLSLAFTAGPYVALAMRCTGSFLSHLIQSAYSKDFIPAVSFLFSNIQQYTCLTHLTCPMLQPSYWSQMDRSSYSDRSHHGSHC